MREPRFVSACPHVHRKNIINWQLWAAAAYLALLPSKAWTFSRSLAFGIAAALAAVIVVAGWVGRGARVPYPGHAIVATLFVWCAWSVASLLWSLDRDYSATQAKREIGESLLAILAFYVAPRSPVAWRTLVGVALVAFAIYATLVLGAAVTPTGWDPARWHSGIGPYATHVVLVAPLLLTLLAPPPIGFGSHARNMLFGLRCLRCCSSEPAARDGRVPGHSLAR